MNVKTRRTKKQVNVEKQAIKLLSKEELGRKIEVIKKELRSYTWRDLETNGKFAKNDKLDITVRGSRQSGQFRASVPVAQSHSDLT